MNLWFLLYFGQFIVVLSSCCCYILDIFTALFITPIVTCMCHKLLFNILLEMFPPFWRYSISRRVNKCNLACLFEKNMHKDKNSSWLCYSNGAKRRDVWLVLDYLNDMKRKDMCFIYKYNLWVCYTIVSFVWVITVPVFVYILADFTFCLYPSKQCINNTEYFVASKKYSYFSQGLVLN